MYSGSHSCKDSSKGDFPRLWINDIEDMLILVVQNRLINLSGDDVADFAIALRMFTRSLVIQKRVEDLQLRVESYQKKINITKPDTTRLDLRKRHPYTPYKDPQGFIYVDDYKRNRLMRSDELHKFSNGTLTRLLSSLEDITKNIDMEYLPKRRWSTLEKKRVHFMIKDINKLLKERRRMMSLEKFIGAGNPVKKILLKLDLSGHKSILTDSKIFYKSPELVNESYVLYDRVMNPLTAQHERKTRKDRGTRRGRHSTSSSSAFDQPSSSHLNDDDDD
ncbi:hypothetical protein Tco_0674226 [Tanacetum coccineum]